MEGFAAALIGMLIGIAAWNGAFWPSRLKQTLLHMWRTEWREFADVKAWLVDQGYELIRDERYPMSGAIAHLRKDWTYIAIESDRGFWTVSAGPTASGPESHLVDAWAVCLGTPTVVLRDKPTHWWLDLRLQLAYLREHVAAIESACSPEHQAETLACLDRARRSIDSRDIQRR